jgi:hypothetical protein
MPKLNVTPAKALDALHVFTSLATALSTQSQPARFAYKSGAAADDPTYSEMSFFNSLPALVVWLFLVTNPDYLAELDTDPDFTTNSNFVTVEQIAAAANLLPEAVVAILNVYSRPDPTLSADEQASLKQSFKDVAQAFDSFTQGLSKNWPVGAHCPGYGTAMRQLAAQGAIVDPKATDFPAYPGFRK